MKKILKVSLFTLSVVLSSNVYGAIGTGHAQVELQEPLVVDNQTTLDFAQVAIDPSAGAQTLSMTPAGVVTCPATYACSGTTTNGVLRITGTPGGSVNVSVTGQTATLDDGSSNTLTFDPVFTGASDTLASVALDGATGIADVSVGGSIDFAGTETAGTYSSTAGTGYTVTVNY
ncbi:MAG: DUF4402 domain-containing protein [Alphaproteobacteria bacterium]